MSGRALLAWWLLASTSACHTLEVAAAKDPMRCERDPSCQGKRGRTFDCNTQCADDPECVDRCMQVQVQSGASSR